MVWYSEDTIPKLPISMPSSLPISLFSWSRISKVIYSYLYACFHIAFCLFLREIVFFLYLQKDVMVWYIEVPQ